MRNQFVRSTLKILDSDPSSVLLLGDIGVFGFREAFARHPDRVYNTGILEQATIGMAAGMALAGMNPLVHTIAPFLVERAYEQLKIDFGYQKLRGTFVSVGGSYDYSGLGCTHHCPGDVNLIENIDGFSIFVPGHPKELESIFVQTSGWNASRYIRLSETSNKTPQHVDMFRPTLIRRSRDNGPTVIAVGPCLDMVLEAAEELPCSIYYTVAVHPPFYTRALGLVNPNIIVVEPYYSSQLANRIAKYNLASNSPINARTFSLHRSFIEEYGDKSQIGINIGFCAKTLRAEIKQWT